MEVLFQGWLSKSENGQLNKDGVLHEMLRLMSECEEGALDEVLSAFLNAHAQGTFLTVVDARTRDILATTDRGNEQLLRSIVYSIPGLDRKCYFLVGQRCSVVFRRDIDCVRIIPLVMGKRMEYALVVEQPKQVKTLPRQYYDLLALCVYCETLKKDLWNAGQIERVSRLKNRSVFLKDAQEHLAETGYKIVVISLSEDALFKRGEIRKISAYHGKLADYLKKDIPVLYALDIGSIAFLCKGAEYDVIADVNGLIDGCMEEGFDVCVGISSLEDDVYQSLYFAEKGSRMAGDGQVIYIKDKDSLYTREDIYETFRDPSVYALGEDIKTATFRPFQEPRQKDEPDLTYEWNEVEEEG